MGRTALTKLIEKKCGGLQATETNSGVHQLRKIQLVIH